MISLTKSWLPNAQRLQAIVFMMEKQKNLLVFLAENERFLGKSHGQFPNGGNNKPSVPRASIIWPAHAVKKFSGLQMEV